MKKHQTKSKKGFTLVELIIVITILAILATIAFISFKSYSGSARDSNRIATVKNIQNGLELLSIKKGNYPDSENMVEIMGSGISLKQGVFGENLQQAIKISGNVKDPLDAAKYIYSTNLNNTKYQLGTYLEENNLIGYFPQTHASSFDYSKKYFYTIGHKIGILLEEDNSPILKEKYSTGLNLEGNSNKFKVYFSNGNNSGNYVGNGDQLTQKIVEVQTQTTSPEDNSGDTESSEPVYDCNNVTDENAFTFNNGSITGYNKNIGGLDVVIPCTINGEIVTSIGGFAFGFKGITSLKIPNTVTTFGTQAFFGNNLTSLVIPNQITNLPTQVFANNKLTSIIIPNSVTTIGGSAFSSNKLTSIIIPNSVTTIGDSAFSSNQLTNIVISDNVTTLGTSLFEGNQLSNIVIPNSVTTLGRYVFKNNQLISVTIPNNVTTIGDSAFENNQLTNIIFGSNVTSIGLSVFSWNKLTNITIPNNITSIQDYAFSYNGALQDSGNITDWTSGNGGTWNLSGTTWIK